MNSIKLLLLAITLSWSAAGTAQAGFALSDPGAMLVDYNKYGKFQ